MSSLYRFYYVYAMKLISLKLVNMTIAFRFYSMLYQRFLTESKRKLTAEPGFEPRTSRSLAWLPIDFNTFKYHVFAPMGRFQLESIYLYFPPTSTPTKPVDNVVIATKGLQDRSTNITAGTTVENKGKLILTN